jgi:alpha-L-fucosidase 2
MSFVLLDLHPLFNNDGISWDHCLEDGDFDGEGGTYPAESLPPSNSLCGCQDIPFFFPSKEDGALNNVALEGQRLAFPAGRYHSLYLLGAADSGYFAEWLEVEEEDGRSRCCRLELSSWHGFEGPRFNERPGLVCSGYHSGDLGDTHSDGRVQREVWMWVQCIALEPRRPLRALIFPDNPCLHLFAATLEQGR